VSGDRLLEAFEVVKKGALLKKKIWNTFSTKSFCGSLKNKFSCRELGKQMFLILLTCS